MAEKNRSTMESWAERPAVVQAQSWISEDFARQNEALLKSRQASRPDDSPASEALAYLLPPACLAVARDLAIHPTRSSITGKIAKRKSRASKRTPTTYINADPANFRRMVQEVTGIRLGEARLQVEPVDWHEQRWCAAGQPQSYLPTLDTSALLPDHGALATASCGAIAPAADCSFFESEAFPSFPTLESWGAM